MNCLECGMPQPKDPELSMHLQGCFHHNPKHCLVELMGEGLTDERITYLKLNYFDPPILTPLIKDRTKD